MKYGITFHPGWWHKYAGIDFSRDFFENAEYRLDCDVKMRKTLYDVFGKYGIGEKHPEKRPILGSDLIAAGYLYSELAGCRVVYSDDDSPQVICLGLSEDDLSSYKIGDFTAHPLYKNMTEQAEYLRSAYGRVIPCVNLMGIQNIALDLMGQELFMAYYSVPDETNALLSAITDMSIKIGKYFKNLSQSVSGGVTAIVDQVMPECYLTSNCSVEMLSNDLYEEFLLKYDQKLADTFSCFGVHHCGQTMEHVAEGYAKLKNLAFAEVGAGSDVAFVRKTLPNVFFNARYSPVTIKNESRDEIFAKVRSLKLSGGIKTSISCVGIDAQAPIENIADFLEACEEVSKERI